MAVLNGVMSIPNVMKICRIILNLFKCVQMHSTAMTSSEMCRCVEDLGNGVIIAAQSLFRYELRSGKQATDEFLEPYSTLFPF